MNHTKPSDRYVPKEDTTSGKTEFLIVDTKDGSIVGKYDQQLERDKELQKRNEGLEELSR